jgi:hypothetical protein
MEQELNYLSEKIEDIEMELIRCKQNKACLCSQQAKDYYTDKINETTIEKQLLESILSALTNSELNKKQ